MIRMVAVVIIVEAWLATTEAGKKNVPKNLRLKINLGAKKSTSPNHNQGEVSHPKGLKTLAPRKSL